MTTLTFSRSILKRLREELRTAYQEGNTRLYRVIQGLIWLGEGRAIPLIAELLNVSARTVFNWLKTFMHRGFSWLLKERYKRRGARPKLNKRQKKELYEMITKGPESNGFDCGVWNTAMINELILLRFGVKYNPRYLSTLLKKMGLSYQKARFISDRMDEDEYEKARQEWRDETWPRLLKETKENKAVILFGDEVSFALWGSLGRTWAPRGEQPLVKTTGIRKGLKMYGAIEFNNGDFQYLESLHYSLTQQSFKNLKDDDFPESLLLRLKPLKKQTYKTKEAFIEVLNETLGEPNTTQYQALILKHTQAAGRFHAEGYIQFLKQLLEHFSSKIFLIEDGAAYHNAKVVKAFVEHHQDRLSLVRLPAFSPDFNPIEKLWKNTKRDATHLKYFKTFEDLRDSVLCAFQKYLEDAAQVIRVMKKLRQEAAEIIA